MHILRILLLLLCSAAGAATAESARTGPLQAGDETRLQAQRAIVADLAARHLGRGLGGTTARDLGTLQLLLDRRIVRAGQPAELQAMGVVLGDLLARELDMQWVVYEDEAGRSRALQLGNTRNFLFPVTMISRRVEAGLPVTVDELYAKARAEMEPFIRSRYAQPTTSR